MSSNSNIQLIDTSGAGKGRDQSYLNNIRMNFQNGNLNSAKANAKSPLAGIEMFVIRQWGYGPGTAPVQFGRDLIKDAEEKSATWGTGAKVKPLHPDDEYRHEAA
jgi:hypothetical protein